MDQTTHAARAQLELAIEDAIAFLDQLDGDPDLEDSGDLEDGGDTEDNGENATGTATSSTAAWPKTTGAGTATDRRFPCQPWSEGTYVQPPSGSDTSSKVGERP